MSLTEGTPLGVYEITGQIGAGGMGEVYLATDTKLGREVAIKTLPAALASDKDRLARFEREAKLLAGLNHPHIAAVYSLDEHEGTLYLAMELVEGETLEKKLQSGALPTETTLHIARQIAEALEAAHARGVVHRDLKPANVMVTDDGIVKVLDFGLAKAFSGDPDEASPAHSPALSVAMTQQGMILGTAGYMSPEQASGQATDQRADIWAFGVLVYEMLTGMPLFSGESVPHVLAAVLQTEPDWNRLPKDLHPRLHLLLERCLEKKVRDRYHSIADARVDIERVLRDPAGISVLSSEPPPAPEYSIAKMLVPVGAAVVVTALIVSLIWRSVSPDPATPQLTAFEYFPPVALSLGTNSNLLAFSPSGRHFAVNTEDGILLRSLSELQGEIIPGTDAESLLRSPMFSPDGQFLAYRSSDGALKRISIGGGTPIPIANVEDQMFGASWGRDETIVFGQDDGVYRVPADGGEPVPIFEREGDEILSSPVLLPDGEHILYSLREGNDWDSADIVVQSLSTGDRKVVSQGGSDARYVASGHIVFAVGDSLYGRLFDLDSLTASGPPIFLLQGLNRAQRSDSANYGISEDGTLAYLGGTVTDGPRTLVWVDRNNREEALGVDVRAYRYAKISPDGSRLALDIRDMDRDIWTWDLARSNLQQLTFDAGINRGTLWTPDSQMVIFSREFGSTEEIWWQRADGSGEPEQLTDESGQPMWPMSISPDGDTLLYQGVAADPADIWMIDIDGPPTEGQVLLGDDANERNAAFSPDGRWIAYESDESGEYEVYVRPFPDVDSELIKISTAGGTRPHWCCDGRELFYFTLENGMGTIKSVSIEASDGFTVSDPVTVVRGAYLATNAGPNVYDVTTDGQRFLMIKDVSIDGEATQPKVVVIQNWVEGELKRLIPTE